MADIFPEILNEASSVDKQPREDAAKELETLWKQDESWGDTWEDAHLREVTRYLLGAKGLVIPPRWAWIIPSHL